VKEKWERDGGFLELQGRDNQPNVTKRKKKVGWVLPEPVIGARGCSGKMLQRGVEVKKKKNEKIA